MDPDLQAKLARRQNADAGGNMPSQKRFNPYTEFPDLTRKEIREYEATFKKYDTGKDGFLDLQELKYMMEKLGHPQTHIALKAMIKEVDEDYDGLISLREFLLIFYKATKGTLQSQGLKHLAKEVDVDKEGVGGAKNFFEAKINAQARDKRNEDEIKAEQAEKREEKKQAAARKANFKAKFAAFQ
mmetsp:Transcript_809/g.940  ORF Transcript_809/g.940 Transcript_809/m.940 type:complete len:185 (-) Transcript_809:31-585(-)